jgi:hypothetical protein
MPPVVLSAASEGTNVFVCYLILLTTMFVSVIIIRMVESNFGNALPEDERVAAAGMSWFAGCVLLACVMFLFILGVWAVDQYASKHKYNG